MASFVASGQSRSMTAPGGVQRAGVATFGPTTTYQPSKTATFEPSNTTLLMPQQTFVAPTRSASSTSTVRRTRERLRRRSTKAARTNPSDTDAQLRTVVSVVTMVTAPVAMAVSYNRNHSVGWALVHGLISIPYLAYVAISGKKP